MKNFFQAPLSNLVALLLAVAVVATLALSGSGGAPELATLGVSNIDVLQAGDGSASEPAFGFTADTDTGIYRGAANDLRFATGGSQRLSITSSGLTIADGLTLSAGSISLPASVITASMIANITRTVNLPLRSWIECTTDAGADINFTDGADAFPDFINSSTNGLGFSLTFDASTADTAFVCNQLNVPQDYISGGAITVEATKGAETGANSEVINCAGSINGAALGTAGTVTTSGTAAARYVCTPTLTGLAAGNSLGIEIHITSGGTADDAVNVLAIAFEYTASE